MLNAVKHLALGQSKRPCEILRVTQDDKAKEGQKYTAALWVYHTAALWYHHTAALY